MINTLYSFLFSYKRVWLVIALLIWVLFGYWASQIHIQEDISKTLPKGGDLEKYQDFFNRSPIASKVVVAIGSSGEEVAVDELISLGQSYLDGLGSGLAPLIDTVQFDFGLGGTGELEDFLYRGLPYFLDARMQDSLLGDTDSNLVPQSVQRTLSRLMSPEGFALKSYLLRDPMGLYPEVLKKLSGLREGGDFAFRNEHLFTEDGQYILALITPSFPPSESKNNGKLVDGLRRARQTLTDQNSDIEFHIFGGPVVAARNGEQIRKDTQLAGTLAIVLILALLFWYYRKVLIPFLFLLPPLFGMTVAIGVIYLLRGEISTLTLAAGTIVLGIALDYCFHFFTHLKHSASVVQAIKDISGSLVLSCFTTVLAFLSLLFLDSQVLTDFGLLASFSLIGTLFFVLLVYPVLLDGLDISASLDGKRHWVDRVFSRSTRWRRPVFLFIVGVTVFLAFFVGNVSFEDDLNAVNYFPEDLQQAEAVITNSESKERSVFVVSRGTDFQDALDANEGVSAILDSLATEDGVNSVVSLNHIFPTSQEARRRSSAWNDRLNSGVHDDLINKFRDESEANGLKRNGFSAFYNLLSSDFEDLPSYPQAIISDPLFANFILPSSEGVELISVVNTSPDQVQMIEGALANTEAVVIDKSLMAGSLIQVVQDNFNLILMITTALVFLTLLINYGRIELALMTFIPMVISWFWILGICGLFDIPFNFINVLVTTFIFGLGDDFCIFVSDGLLSKFKLGKDKLSSYRSSIVLSTTTTIIGTGVLLFAKHPALQSIALLSVIGMLCISFISLTLQPIIFHFAVEKRKEKGLAPLTFFIILTTIISFGYFALGCLIVTLLIPIFFILPIPKARKRKIFSWVISKFAGSVIYLMVNVRKQVRNPHKEDFKKPAVIIANHQSFVDILAILMLNPRIVILTNEWVWKSPLFGWAVRYAGFPTTAGSELEDNMPGIEKNLEQGYSIAIFPEGTRSVDGKMKRFHKGAFLLAEKYDLDIIPVLLHGFNYTIRKSDYTLLSGHLTIQIMKRISSTDLSFGEGYRARTKTISAYMRSEFEDIRRTEENTNYHRDAVVANYIYKGPVLEWYVKSKMRLENNFEAFHQHTPREGLIYDLGCGYGYLAYELKFTSAAREVIGLDFDEQKVEVARHGYAKDDKISFDVADLSTYRPPRAKGYILKDVLHYLKPLEQKELLQHCASQLEDEGTIIIRDGFEDEENHRATELSEVLSIKLLKFNRAKGELSFLKESLLTDLAREFNMKLTKVDADKRSSNRTFVLTTNTK